MIYAVTFDRIGRNAHNVKENFVANDAEELAAVIYRYSRKHLRSKEYDVDVDLGSMTGTIEYGRFGEFKIAIVQLPLEANQ